MINIPVIRDYYKDKEYIFTKKSLELKPGLTVIVGCNGSGKTTLLNQINHFCKSQNIPHFKFDNLHDGGRNARDKAGFFGNFEFLAESLSSSEGENINMNIGNCAMDIGRLIRNNPTAKQIVIMFDAIDSGLSVDYIIEVKEYLFKTIINDCLSKNIEVYIIASANEYELARGEECLRLPSLTYKPFKNYEEYRKFIIETRNKKNKRYGHDPFEFT